MLFHRFPRWYHLMKGLPRQVPAVTFDLRKQYAPINTDGPTWKGFGLA